MMNYQKNKEDMGWTDNVGQMVGSKWQETLQDANSVATATRYHTAGQRLHLVRLPVLLL